MMAAPRYRQDVGDSRARAIAKVKIAAKQLGLDDATYRAMLSRITGQDSAAKCTEAQLGRVLDEMKAKGWKASKPAARSERSASSTRHAAKQAVSPLALKARAMWISLHQLGEVRDPSEAALEAFARRQLGVDRLQWAVPSQGAALIEALKAMAERAGWSQDTTGLAPDERLPVLKARLAELIAQREAGR
ncbi:regulatory protein GemA [Brevundimonas vitis]|uniref:Regulatory protein GemA n=1 Tax=Brevundimonas vitisensis TaxID=2800818 RepID=A0ABX7BJN3_9CAUL|nr:regulatory protein GemA [Brevundimonas vitisensis]QQQ17769.1 regulatory protein GemA [Brevundimonas vitisensis]